MSSQVAEIQIQGDGANNNKRKLTEEKRDEKRPSKKLQKLQDNTVDSTNKKNINMATFKAALGYCRYEFREFPAMLTVLDVLDSHVMSMIHLNELRKQVLSNEAAVNAAFGAAKYQVDSCMFQCYKFQLTDDKGNPRKWDSSSVQVKVIKNLADALCFGNRKQKTFRDGDIKIKGQEQLAVKIAELKATTVCCQECNFTTTVVNGAVNTRDDLLRTLGREFHRITAHIIIVDLLQQKKKPPSCKLCKKPLFLDGSSVAAAAADADADASASAAAGGDKKVCFALLSNMVVLYF